MFSNTVRVLYLYLISFVFLMMCIGAIIFTVNTTATLVFEEPSCECSRYNDWDGYCGCSNNANRNSEIRSVVSSAFSAIIAGGLFAFHWNIIEKERAQVNVKEEELVKTSKTKKVNK